MKLVLLIAAFVSAGILRGAEALDHPFVGITSISRTGTAPRNWSIHVIEIDLTARGIRFKLTPPGGALETIRQTTLDFVKQQRAQVAVNAHFFTPFPSTLGVANVIGLAASDGVVYSGFESPEQSYAIVPFAPAINIDPSNHAGIVHCDARFNDHRHIRENVRFWNALAGSAQIITNGVKSIPAYSDVPSVFGFLTPGGPRDFSNRNSWYDQVQARTAIGITRDGNTLVLFTVDRAGGSLGMTVGEVAGLLLEDYRVYNALNLDGGGSTTLALENPGTHKRTIVNTSSDNPNGRSVGSNLAVFAQHRPGPRQK